MSVLLFWGAFFETPKPDQKSKSIQLKIEWAEKIKIDSLVPNHPNIESKIELQTVSRDDSIKKV